MSTSHNLFFTLYNISQSRLLNLGTPDFFFNSTSAHVLSCEINIHTEKEHERSDKVFFANISIAKIEKILQSLLNLWVVFFALIS